MAQAISNITEVDRLLLELELNLKEAKLSLKQQEDLLGRVKIFGRDPRTAGPIFAQRGIITLCRYGLDYGSTNTSREALRCLANAFLLNEPSRQKFVDLGYAGKAAERLESDDLDDEFLICRMLFLLTYNTKVDFAELDTRHRVADYLNRHIVRHSVAFSQSARDTTGASPIEGMAMGEILKLIFNITHYYPNLVAKFSPSMEPLVKILLCHPLPAPPLQPPITSLLNALLNLDLAHRQGSQSQGEKMSPMFPQPNTDSVVNRLTLILDRSIREHSEKELDEAAAPLCTLIRRINELAPLEVQDWLRLRLLPSDQDREKPLGQGDKLSAHLLRLSCSPNLPTLSDNIASLLFELSDKDPSKFVKNIGYGFASGFLKSHDIVVPNSAIEGSSTEETSSGMDINPVTGQRVSAEDVKATEEDEMTAEEKEREAERLFVLFERLRATGVVNVKNPVQQARDEGRFEELD